MQASGFVLAGGASKRMGRDKALLPFAGATLVEHVAQIVKQVAGFVALIGDPTRLSHLGLPVFPDDLSGAGPAGGIYTALRVSKTDWNLIVACDMPGITAETLREILRRTETSHGVSCIAAAGRDGHPEPLCAVYHRRSLPALAQAITDGRLKMRGFLAEIGAVSVPIAPSALANVNTPAEWSEFAPKPSHAPAVSQFEEACAPPKPSRPTVVSQLDKASAAPKPS